MIEFSVLLPPSSPTPGEVLNHGEIEAVSQLPSLALAFPGTDIINRRPPSSKSYWDYSTSWWFERPDRPDELATWDYVAKVWLPADLGDRRARQWKLIKESNDAADLVDLAWSGHVFQVDAESRERLRQALLDSMLATAAGETWSIDWTLADNSSLTMSAADMATVNRALAARTKANHELAQAKRALIYASSTPEDITWTSTP